METYGHRFSMYSVRSLFPPAAPEKPLIKNLEIKKEDVQTPDIITEPSVPNCSASRRPCKHQEKRERMEREEEGLNPQEEERQAVHTGEGTGEEEGDDDVFL